MADLSTNPQPPLPPPPSSSSDETPAVFTAPSLAVTENEPPPAAVVADLPVKPQEAAVVVESEKPPAVAQQKLPPESLVSFKEESSKVADLSENEKRALDELKQLVRESIATGQFTTSPPPPPPTKEEKEAKESEKEEKQEPQHATIQEMLAVSAESISDASGKESSAVESEVFSETNPSDDSKFEEKSPPVATVTDSAAPEVSESVVAAVVTDEKTAPAVSPVDSQTLAQATVAGGPEITASLEEVSIWGVPLLKDDRTDVILLKFLRARDFKVKDAFVMITNTLRWRKEFRIDDLVNEDLGDDLDKVVFMHGYDREGHPVCYNVYGEFQNKDLYHKTFSDQEKRSKFLRWRIQFLERSIRKLDFRPGGVCTIFQVIDLKNAPGPAKRELRLATKQALHILQDNYPEFAAKQVFINVPWWHLAFYTMMSPFLTQRTKSKFVFVSAAKSAEKLFKYISPEQVPIQYGGLSVDSCDCNPEFTFDDPVTEIAVKPATKQTVEILVSEKCIIIWEVRVVGWEVSYGAEFVPNTEDGYTVIIHKTTKMSPADEPVISNNYKIDELGKIILAIDNPTTKKKNLLYRFKVVPFSS